MCSLINLYGRVLCVPSYGAWFHFTMVIINCHFKGTLAIVFSNVEELSIAYEEPYSPSSCDGMSPAISLVMFKVSHKSFSCNMSHWWVPWQTSMHLKLGKHILFDEVLALLVCLDSQGSNEHSQHVKGLQLDGERKISLVDVNVSTVKSYTPLILTRKQDYAFVCELPNFLHFQFKRWDPGGLVNLIVVWSFNFKQWDPDKFIQGCNFYNLEDKVGLDGVGIVMSKDMGRNKVRLKIESNELVRAKRIATPNKWNDYVAI